MRLSSRGCVEPVDYQCASCAHGYKFIDGSCIKVIQGCLKYKNSNQCAQCQEPFKLTINGECQILGCFKYCESGCLQCKTPFVQKNYVCLIDYCQKYAIDGCSECQDGYLLVNGRCEKKDVNCLKYSFMNGNVVCEKCV